MAGIIVRPDKNEFLLYSMLDSLGLSRGIKYYGCIRNKAADSFKGYEGLGLNEKDYIHHSKPVAYVLTITEAPEFEEKDGLELNGHIERDVQYGKTVLPHLRHFYENTDFENVYGDILPLYQEECKSLQDRMDRLHIGEILDNVWQTDFSMETIPMPLEGERSGIGPSIGNVAYQIVGPPFDHKTVFLVAHEGSHPRAKAVLEPIRGEISKRNGLLKNAQSDPNYPISYTNWATCFEEHLIRAVQACIINPDISGDYKPTENQLALEYRKKGMVYIHDFADEVMKHTKNPGSGGMTEVALRILENIDKKYKS